jgi:hypothetical protein
MQKPLLILFLLFFSFFCRAQNWQCIKPYEKQYFINDDHYLRGMRIDSVRVVGTDTILYPFNTPRGDYLHLDNKGGSWLGKKIVYKPDGTYLFDNLWNDTIIIKSQASLSDSWLMFTDTLGIYFEASVTSIDTMTVLSYLDSVKIIAITAKDSFGNIIAGHLANGKNIVLSKNNGLTQTIELYTFPYRKINEDLSFMNGNSVKAGSSVSIKNFHLIKYNNPKRNTIFNYKVGDVLEYWSNTLQWDYNSYVLDTIVAATILPDGKLYSINRTLWRIFPWTDSIVTTRYNYSLKADTNYPTIRPPENYMPEESPFDVGMRYIINDTSFCKQSDFYEWFGIGKGLGSNGYALKYKEGIGLLKYHVSNWSTGHGCDTTLIHYYIDGKFCGDMKFPAGIKSLRRGYEIVIYPNPATDQLIIETGSKQPYTIFLQDMMGRTMKQQQGSGKTIMDVAGLPAGVYSLKLCEGADCVYRKVLIRP